MTYPEQTTKPLDWFAKTILLVLACGFGASLASVKWSEGIEIPRDVMKVAAYRCAANGAPPMKWDGSFDGLANVQHLRRVDKSKYTIVCRNGAHFYDEVTLKIDDPAAPNNGFGKPPN